MLKFFTFTLLFLGMISGSYAIEPYVRFNAYNYSEPTSINSFLNEFNGRFEGGAQAFAHEWLETGARQGDWEIGLFTRYDFDMSFSEDLAELYYLSTNKLPLDTGKTYQIDLVAKHYKTDGLRLGYSFQADDKLKINIGLAYLRGLKLTDGQLAGEASAISKNDYDFSFQTDYYYSEDPLFDREVVAPSGWGYSVDLSTEWHPTPALGIYLQVNDLLGQIFWDQAPHTVAVANSDNKTFDDDGYVEFLPTLSGLEEYRDFRQSLNAFGSVSADYLITPRIDLLYNGDFTAETYFSGFGAKYEVDPKQTIALLFYPVTEVWEIDYTGHAWRIRLASDAFTLNQSNLMRISGNLYLQF